MNTMDMSQISELATAIMDSWATASSSELLTNNQGTPVQTAEQINKIFGNTIKQEPASVPCEYTDDSFPGVIYAQGGFMMNPTSPPEQVPMDDYDPLESFTFWDGENFYCHPEYDACGNISSDMQMDSAMNPIPEYTADDDTMTRDNVFQVKDSDLLRNPTLAELNSGNETLFDYNLEHNFLPDDSSGYPLMADALQRTMSLNESHFVSSPVSTSIPNHSTFASHMTSVPSGFLEMKQNIQPSLSSSCPVSSRMIPNSQFLGVCDEKFLLCPQNSPASDSFFHQRLETIESKSHVSLTTCGVLSPIPSRLQDSSLLSSSAPPNVSMGSYFSKIKVETQAHSPGHKSSAERSLSGFSSLSLSNDDESGSFIDDSDHEDDFSSDDDLYQYESDELFSTSWPSGKEEKAACQHRKHRFFWQYNLQSRGAKTQNLLPQFDSRDPHVLNDAFDPVFAEECALPVKHSGKARRGDGNDLTPNPCKLFSIGMELKKLNKLIYNINPHEVGSNGKPLSRKEKNKLASRVCRLKKKAQHEANKIKLYGLQQEHKKLITILIDTRELIRYKIENPHDAKVSNCSKKLENYLSSNEPHKVAGNTTAFVNEVLEKVSKGESNGGLGQL